MNNLPKNLVMKILKSANGTQLAQLATSSTRYRNMIMSNARLLNKIRVNRNWARLPERELRNIAAELRENGPNQGLNSLLARYNREIDRRNRIAAKASSVKKRKRSVKRR